MKIKLNLSKAGERLQAKQEEQSRARRGHVLLVDDERENLDGLEAVLSAEGYEVSATTSPEEALAVARTRGVDLIISDQRMPVMLGTELLAAIKAHSDDNMRVILTGHTDMNDLISCINSGLLFRYLVKPWRREEVLAVVEEGLKKIRIDRAVHKLVPEQVWERLYAGRLEETRPGEGQRVECVAMCIDVRNFTALSAHLTPSQVFSLLSEVMGALSPLIKERHGYLDKHLGDGAVVLFDRPGECARDAIECARGFGAALRALNREGGPLRPLLGDAPVRVGVGMHVGAVMLGTVGSAERLEFTTLGDTLSVASRVESLTSRFVEGEEECVVLCSAEVVAAAGWEGARPLGEQLLKGKEERVALFKI